MWWGRVAGVLLEQVRVCVCACVRAFCMRRCACSGCVACGAAAPPGCCSWGGAHPLGRPLPLTPAAAAALAPGWSHSSRAVQWEWVARVWSRERQGVGSVDGGSWKQVHKSKGADCRVRLSPVQADGFASGLIACCLAQSPTRSNHTNHSCSSCLPTQPSQPSQAGAGGSAGGLDGPASGAGTLFCSWGWGRGWAGG